MSPAAQGRRLNALRIAMKWSQAELALRTGIDTTSVNRYCKGERPINAKHAWRIAYATGLVRASSSSGRYCAILIAASRRALSDRVRISNLIA
jgi:transcriptional regulator with XRE-family HTH domain